MKRVLTIVGEGGNKHFFGSIRRFLRDKVDVNLENSENPNFSDYDGIFINAGYHEEQALLRDLRSQTDLPIMTTLDRGDVDEGYIEKVDGVTYYDHKDLSVLTNFMKNLGNKQRVRSHLDELLPELDLQTKEKLTKDIDAEISLVTNRTGSVGVVDFEQDGKKGYCKISTSTKALDNEHRALQHVQKNRIASVLAPKPIGLALMEGIGALLTWGTENKENYDPEALKEYELTFNTLLVEYAKKTNQDLQQLVKDPRMRDVFNTAIIHTSLDDYVSLNERPAIIPVEKLEKRASADGQVFTKLRTFNRLYNDAKKRTKSLDPGDKVFIHGDNRPENTGDSPYGIRPKVDWANARMGDAVEDLAALETDPTKYTEWYRFVVETTTGKPVTKDLDDLTLCHSILQPYRTGSFKLSKGRLGEASQDVSRLERNAQLYLARFK